MEDEPFLEMLLTADVAPSGESNCGQMDDCKHKFMNLDKWKN